MDGDVTLVTAMRRAIVLAGDPLVRTGPNPRVGCVLLDEAGTPLAEGHHRGAGTAHAEVDALAALPPQARSRLHTAVVTLEPCDHTGRTGPCTVALLQAGVRRVVFAVPDPDPVAGGGADRLRAAGVDVVAGFLTAEGREVDPGWLAAAATGRPHVTWKVATTLDGRVAAADRTSRWITGPAARADAHEERRLADAVLVGTGTALADDPQLTVRHEGWPLPAHLQPLRVVVGHRLLPTSSHLLDGAARTVQVTERDPHVVLTQLWDRGVRRVLIEGGPTLAAAFVRAGLVDRVVHYLAPAVLGAGPTAIGDLGIATMDDIARFAVTDLRTLPPDVRVTLIPRPDGTTGASVPGGAEPAPEEAP